MTIRVRNVNVTSDRGPFGQAVASTWFPRNVNHNMRGGELLLFVIRYGGTHSIEITPPTGAAWTLIGRQPSDVPGVSPLLVYGRIATGTETNFGAFEHTGSSTTASSVLFRVRGWSGDLDDIEVGFADSLQPPEVNPAWSEETLWITGVCGRRFDWEVDDDGPSGYPVASRSLIFADPADQADGTGMVTQYRVAENGDAEQPGAWSVDYGAGNESLVLPRSFTIGVKSGSSGGENVLSGAGRGNPTPLGLRLAWQDTLGTSLSQAMPVNVGGEQSGDLLLAFIRVVSRALTEWSAGWHMLGRRASGNGFVYVLGSIAPSSAAGDSLTITSGGNFRAAWIIRRYTDWDGSLDGVDVSFYDDADSITPTDQNVWSLQPPPLAPEWDASYWISLLTGRRADWRGEEPSNYGDLQTAGHANQTSTAYGRVAMASREMVAPAASEQSDAWTHTNTIESQAAGMIAILGAAVGGTVLPVALPPLLGPPSAMVKMGPPSLLRSRVEYYAMLEWGGGSRRLAIRSWQGTRQLNNADFLQVVVPVPTQEELDGLTAALGGSDPTLSVFEQAKTVDGDTHTERMMRVSLGEWYLNRGPRQLALTISGYWRGAKPESVEPSRRISGVQTDMMTARGRSVRCSLDPFLLPGMLAEMPGTAALFPVHYINYYVGSGEAWMQVGERT